MLRFVAFFAILAAANAQTTSVSQCTENPGTLPLNAYIGGCASPPCDLPQLENVLINLVFRAPHTMRSMRTEATAYLPPLFGIVVSHNYDLAEQANTCNFLANTYCPVLGGEIVQYNLHMYIESFFPRGTQANIEFRVIDENSNPVTCIRVPIRIVAPLEGAKALTQEETAQ